jgi:hypothetical protein
MTTQPPCRREAGNTAAPHIKLPADVNKMLFLKGVYEAPSGQNKVAYAELNII